MLKLLLIMQIIYKPIDLLEAQMLVSMLNDEGIQAFVNGTNLLGGVGLLPASDLFNITTNDADAKNAKHLIDSYLSADFDIK